MSLLTALFPSPIIAQEISLDQFVKVPGRPYYNYFSKDLYTIDPVLGLKHRPSQQVRHIRRSNLRKLYDVTYTIDNYGRRAIPHSDGSAKKKFILFFGCSYTFGIGLNDDQTLPYYLAQRADSDQIYNYSLGGTGANYLLAQLETLDLADQVEQDTGIGIYVYASFHIDRSVGILPGLAWGALFPFYRWGKNGRLIQDGSFLTGRTWRTKTYLLIDTLSRYFGVEFFKFPRVSSADAQKTCALISQARDEFLVKFPNSTFITVIHPFSRDHALTPAVTSCLRSNAVLVLQANEGLNASDLHIPDDDHPSPPLNQKLSDFLIKNI